MELQTEKNPPAVCDGTSLVQAANAALQALPGPLAGTVPDETVIQTFLRHLSAAGFVTRVLLPSPGEQLAMYTAAGPAGLEAHPRSALPIHTSVIETGRSQFVAANPPAALPQSGPPLFGYPSLLAPLGRQKPTAGCLHVESPAFSAADLPLAEAAAHLLASCLEAARSEAQAVEAWRESEERLRSLVNGTPDIVCFKDGQGRWLEANPADLTLFQIEHVDYKGKTDAELADYSPFYREAFLTCMDSDELAWQKKEALTRSIEIIPRPDGSETVLDIIKAPLFYPNGERKGLVVLGRDITERYRAERQLSESEERFRNLVENAVLGVYRTTPDGQILMANQALVSMLGYNSFEELAQLNLEDRGFEARANRQHFKELVERDGQVRGLDGRWQRKDGTWLYVRESARAVSDETGQVLYYEGTVEDITQRKQAEIALVQRAEELSQLHQENAHLLEAERRGRQEAETLRQATAALTSSLNLNEVLDRILIHLEQVVPYSSAAVFLVDGNQMCGAAGRGFANPETVVDQVFPLDESLLHAVQQTQTTMILRDAQADPRFRAWSTPVDHIHGWMGVPLIAHGHLLGFLTCDHYQVGVYNSQHAQLAQAFANQAAVAIENARLFEAERSQLLLAQTLQAVGALLTAQLSLQQVLDSILNLLGQVVKFDSASIQLLDADGILTLAAGHGFDDLGAASETARNLSETVMTSKWRNHKLLLIPDTSADDSWVITPTSAYIRSWIGAALLVRGRFIGCLNVDNKKVNAYDQAMADTVMAFANQAAVAIENARLFEAERSARERAEALREATQIIGSTLALDQVLQAVLEQIARVIPYDTGNVFLVQEDHQAHIYAWRGYEAYYKDLSQLEGITFDMEASPTTLSLIQQGHTLMIPNVAQEPRWVHSVASQHIRSWLGVPLRLRDQVIGFVGLDRVITGGFNDEEVALAQTFAINAATAIENARLFEAAGQRAAELEAMRQASLSLTASLDLPQVLNAILKNALSLLPQGYNSHIFLYNPENGGKLTFGAALWADGATNHVWSKPRPHGLTYTVARSGEPVVINDMSTHPLYQDEPPDWANSIVGLPLKIGQRVVGVMNISYRSQRQFSPAELRLLQLLGDQAAIAIENARLFEQAATERRHLSLLYDISSETASSMDADSILEHAITLTSLALNGSVGQAYLYIPDKNRLSLRALFGRDLAMMQNMHEHLDFELGDGLAGWVALNRQAVRISNVLENKHWKQVPGIDDDIQSAICAPILYEDRLVGVMTVLHRQEANFTQDHLTLMQAICRQLALALSNANRYQQMQRRLAEITLIQNLAQTFTRRLELPTLLKEVTTQVSRRLGYPQVEIFLREGEGLVLKAFYKYEPHLHYMSLDQGVIGRVARSGEAVLVADVDKDEDYIHTVPSTLAELAVPIFQNDQVIGVMNIESDQAGQLGPQDRNLLELLAGQIAIALENAELYERVRRHAEDLEQTVAQRTAELTELYKLSQEISYQLSYDELLRLLLHHLYRAIPCEFVAGCLLGDPCPDLSIATRRHLTRRALETVRQRWLDVLAEYGQDRGCEDQLVFDINPNEDYDSTAQPIQQVNTVIHAPIFVDQQLVGVVMAGSHQLEAFSQEQARLLTTFANQTGAAVQRMQAVLAAQQEHLENLVENLPVGTLLFDAEFRLLVANPLGRQIFTLLNPDLQTGINTPLGEYSLRDLIAHEQDPLPFEISLEGPPHHIFAAQIRPIGGDQNQWLLTVRETTQEHENQKRISSQERLATVGQLAAGIAHDFNNIMAAILVYADLLVGDPAVPIQSREKLHIIQQQVQRASILIRQILDFSRRSVMDQSALDLLPFMKELEKMLGRILPETIHVQLTFQDDAYWVNADPTRLQQALMNLALNARDAMTGGGQLILNLNRIELDAESTPPMPDMIAGPWVCISVTDTGEGISSEVMGHIFEPFFTTKSVGQGTGLGLAQVYGIIKQHDGFIDVHSQPGEGTRVSLYLPASNPPDTAPTNLENLEPVTGNREMILVVEDNAATLDALRALLESRNFLVLTATNGMEAIEQYHLFAPSISLVISDMVMPEMGGMDLYRELTRQWPNVHMLFITGHPLDSDSQALLERSHIRWLQKPFSVNELNQAVQKLLQERSNT